MARANDIEKLRSCRSYRRGMTNVPAMALNGLHESALTTGTTTGHSYLCMIESGRSEVEAEAFRALQRAEYSTGILAVLGAESDDTSREAAKPTSRAIATSWEMAVIA